MEYLVEEMPIFWARWFCPHDDCIDDENGMLDPSDIFVTTCHKGHNVILIWNYEKETVRGELE